jgi:hypothetical protein
MNVSEAQSIDLFHGSSLAGAETESSERRPAAPKLVIETKSPPNPLPLGIVSPHAEAIEP